MIPNMAPGKTGVQPPFLPSLRETPRQGRLDKNSKKLIMIFFEHFACRPIIFGPYATVAIT
jgi:hypothetical protein